MSDTTHAHFRQTNRPELGHIRNSQATLPGNEMAGRACGVSLFAGIAALLQEHSQSNQADASLRYT